MSAPRRRKPLPGNPLEHLGKVLPFGLEGVEEAEIEELGPLAAAPQFQSAEHPDLNLPSLARSDPDETELEPVPSQSTQAEPAEDNPAEVETELEPPEAGTEPVEVEPAAPVKKLAIGSRRAKMNGPVFLPLFDQAADDLDDDVFSHILSAMGGIEPDQNALLSFSVRTYPQYAHEAQEWITGIKAGATSITPPAGIEALARVIGFSLRLTVYLLGSIFSEIRGAKTPQWKRRTPAGSAPLHQLDETDKALIKGAGDKRKGNHFEVALSVSAFSLVEPDGESAASRELAALADGLADSFASIGTAHQSLAWQRADERGIDALLGLMGPRVEKELLLSGSELATLVHVPDDTTKPFAVRVPHSSLRPVSPQFMPALFPNSLAPPQGLIPVGLLNKEGDDSSVFGIDNSQLDKHLVVFGTTGAGKSEQMKHIACGIAATDYPLVLIDPHGKLANDTLNVLCTYFPELIPRIVLFDIADTDFPPAINPLDVKAVEDIDSAVRYVMTMLNGSEGFTTAHVRAAPYARKALKALCYANLQLSDANKVGLLHVAPFFTNDEFRKVIMEYCPVPDIIDTFDEDSGTYERLGQQQRDEHSGAVVRIFQTLSEVSAVGRLFATNNRFNIGELIAEKKIILVKLARFSEVENVGDMVARLIIPTMLGSIDLWGRHQDDETGAVTGVGCRALIDEIPVLFKGNEQIQHILAEARKWDLGMLMAGQFAEQLEPGLRKAIFSLTQSKIVLRLDAKNLAGFNESISSREVKITPQDISSLHPFTGYASVLTPDDKQSGPFAFHTIPPLTVKYDAQLKQRREQVRDNSRKLISVEAGVADERLRGTCLVDGPKHELLKKLRETQAEKPAYDSDLPEDVVGAFGPEAASDGFNW
jgi:Helicase HerA, central domain